MRQKYAGASEDFKLWSTDEAPVNNKKKKIKKKNNNNNDNNNSNSHSPDN